jgi:hypothetical protein
LHPERVDTHRHPVPIGAPPDPRVVGKLPSGAANDIELPRAELLRWAHRTGLVTPVLLAAHQLDVGHA